MKRKHIRVSFPCFDVIRPQLQEQQNTGATNTDKQIADTEEQQIRGCSAMRRQQYSVA